jgi:hypothetical protein
MKRLLTLATTGLFATGLAVLPVTVFAQPTATPGTDAKSATASHSMPSDAKMTPATKDGTAGKDTSKVTGSKSGTAPAGSAAKTTGNHDKGA